MGAVIVFLNLIQSVVFLKFIISKKLLFIESKLGLLFVCLFVFPKLS